MKPPPSAQTFSVCPNLPSHPLPQEMQLVRWRLKDRAFFKSVCAALRERRYFPAAVWQYALLHGEQQVQMPA